MTGDCGKESETHLSSSKNNQLPNYKLIIITVKKYTRSVTTTILPTENKLEDIKILFQSTPSSKFNDSAFDHSRCNQSETLHEKLQLAAINRQNVIEFGFEL